jgi:hypothetical protein
MARSELAYDSPKVTPKFKMQYLQTTLSSRHGMGSCNAEFIQSELLVRKEKTSGVKVKG